MAIVNISVSESVVSRIESLESAAGQQTSGTSDEDKLQQLAKEKLEQEDKELLEEGNLDDQRQRLMRDLTEGMALLEQRVPASLLPQLQVAMRLAGISVGDKAQGQESLSASKAEDMVSDKISALSWAKQAKLDRQPNKTAQAASDVDLDVSTVVQGTKAERVANLVKSALATRLPERAALMVKGQPSVFAAAATSRTSITAAVNDRPTSQVADQVQVSTDSDITTVPSTVKTEPTEQPPEKAAPRKETLPAGHLGANHRSSTTVNAQETLQPDTMKSNVVPLVAARQETPGTTLKYYFNSLGNNASVKIDLSDAQRVVMLPSDPRVQQVLQENLHRLDREVVQVRDSMDDDSRREHSRRRDSDEEEQ
ncbi:Uncharacterised protein [Serratia quinivorans]|uniref:SpaN/EivJ family type III secretion system needle length determinant n=1 Tax=Serratia quinivorans TaxID=137545 RepID=UPI0021781071|nr:hypothetical protein [Serratia quinivorans]CAI1904113.1 Uncharacterised protein [Serratia quinivorans]